MPRRTYWYLAPGGTDDYQPVPVADRDNYWNDPKTAIPWPAGWDGIDASSMEVRASNGGRHGPYITDEFAQDWPADLDRHVALWINGKTGDTIEYKVHWAALAGGEIYVPPPLPEAARRWDRAGLLEWRRRWAID